MQTCWWGEGKRIDALFLPVLCSKFPKLKSLFLMENQHIFFNLLNKGNIYVATPHFR